MKTLSALVILLLTMISWSTKNPDFTSSETTKQEDSLKQRIEIFNKELENHVIEPNFTINMDSSTVTFLDFKIDSFSDENGLVIKVNNDEIKTYRLQTQNIVWTAKDSVQYANQISQIKYYKYEKLLLFQITYYPCSGLGCGANYQIIYDLKNKKSFAFGRFRTGFDMNLYQYQTDEKTYYLSKSFQGRNEQLKDTITYELFELTPNLPLRLSEYSAKFMYENDFERETKFESKWIK